MTGIVADPSLGTLGMQHGLVFRCEYVNLCPRKVWKSSAVIEVEVGEDYLFDVTWRISEVGNLSQGSLICIPCDAVECQKGPHSCGRFLVISQSEPGVDKDESLGRLNKKTVGYRWHAEVECHAV